MSQAGQLNLSVFPPGAAVETLTGNTGGPVGPDGVNNINVIGTGVVSVAGNAGTNTLTISVDGTLATTYTTDAGNAVPVAGVLNVLGAHGINTTGAGNTVTVQINNAITLGDLAPIAAGSDALTLTTGDASIVAGNLNLATTASADIGVVEVNAIRFMHSFGNNNTFVGSSAGNFTLTPANAVLNTGLGSNVLASLTDGAANCAAGFFALNACTTGTGNSAFGFSVLPSLTTGNGNTGSGENCLNSLTTGTDNVCYGGGTLSGLLTGSHNIAIGNGTGQPYNAAQSDNILIGPSTLGNVADANTIRIGETGGGAGQQNRCFVAGIDGVNVGSTAKVVTMGTAATADQLGTATITAGAGITVTPGANTITIASIGAGVTWSVITADQTAVVENGYFCNKAGTLLLALPAISVIGDVIEVANENTALGIQFTQAAGQQILIGNTNTTLGATGTLTSSAVGDTLRIVCKTANTIWRVLDVVGNWTPA